MSDKASLLLVTNCDPNPAPDSGAWHGQLEDRFLAERLAPHFDLTVNDPHQAAQAFFRGAHYEICLIRNARPTSFYQASLRQLADIARQREAQTVFYNPPDAYNYIDDRSYLLTLGAKGYDVIPAITKFENIGELCAPDVYVEKPLQGCAPIGVRVRSMEQLRQAKIETTAARIRAVEQGLPPPVTHPTLIEPFVAFEREVSFLFFSRRYGYAVGSDPMPPASFRQSDPDLRYGAAADKMREACEARLEEHKRRRRILTEWQPGNVERQWAQEFVNGLEGMPGGHGILRVDAALMPNGDLRLMKIDRNTPFLSLTNPSLPERIRDHAIDHLIRALHHARKPALGMAM